MTRPARRLLFWLAVIVFTITAPFLIGYARGLRIDLKRGNITQVGAIFLESKPKGAIVFLDGEQVSKKTPALLANLSPFENYSVEIRKEGFKAWSKKLLVEPSKINKVEQIILPPEEILAEDYIATATPLADFYLAPNGQLGLGLHETTEKTLDLYFVDLTGRIFLPVAFPDRLATLDIKELAWEKDGRQAVFLRHTSSGQNWYLFDSTSRTVVNLNITIPSSLRPAAIKFSPDDGFFILTKNDLVFLDPNFDSSVELNTGLVKAWGVGTGRLFVVGENRAFFELDLAGGLIKNYGRLGFEPSLLHPSPDGKKIIYENGNKFGILWLADAEKPPFYKRGYQEIVLETEEKAKSFWWHASSEGFLVFLENKSLVFAELDSRGGRNVWRWETPKIERIVYSSEEKSLWFLSSAGFLTHYPGEF